MLVIEFVGAAPEGMTAQVIDRMNTDISDVRKAVTHAKSLFSNVIVQRTHKPLPHGFRILDSDGREVASWSIDE
ncbi:hypothetical protein EDE12_10366 [Methylosinus sp. sav-2]|jgi:hypothetical protein|uniref:hypothetical protein n=1 Tax=Methylosinus sp. sav-2 TaxID=2485168 RepID=UPI00047CF0B0|nr:hypothetical protein [Methylosinus sp. sav-2]TDX65094.1 hypothetical protein EDE12_10366 [Methylosinus sp. sav-2]